MAYGSDPIVSNSGSGYGKDPAQTGGSQQSAQTDTGGSFRAGAEDFLHGLSSGLAGDIVGAGQLAGAVLPEAITGPISRSGIGQRLSQEANRPSQGIAGSVGNIIGGAAPFLVQPELGIGRYIEAAPAIGRYLKPLWDVIRNATIPAAVQPAESQEQRLVNTGVGTLVGGAAHGLGQAAGSTLKKWAGQRAANQTYDAARDAAQKARETAEARRERLTRFNERVTSRNKALGDLHQEAKDARADQTHLDRVAAQVHKQGQAAVPGQTTGNWWKEALTPIGEQAKAPPAGPEASAKVRQIVGDRLNQIRGSMRIGRDDMGFRTEIDGIRDQIDSRLTNDSIRDQWHYEPQTKFDKDGNPLPPSESEVAKERKTLWSQYVEQPLENLPELSGRQMADYVSRLGDLAEEYARRAMRAPQAERPELEAISQGLRDVVDVVDRRGSQGDATLRANLTAAKRSYNLWSIGNQSVDSSGVATPGKIARNWMKRQGGPANYGAQMDPSHPRYHPENARLKQGLEQARKAHETGPPAPTPQPPLRAPGKKQTIPLPKLPTVPPERTTDQRLPGAVGHVAQHAVTALTGSPTAGRIARGAVHYGGRGVARPALAATKGVGATAPGLAVGSTKIPEIVITAPRYRPGEENEEKK